MAGLLTDPASPDIVRRRVLLTLGPIVAREYDSLDDATVKVALTALIETLKDKQERTRVLAADAISSFCGKGLTAYEPLRAFIIQGSSLERVRGAEALAGISSGDGFAIRVLTESLSDESRLIRCLAASGLKSCSVKAGIAVPALLKALKDEDVGVRLAVVSALGATKSEKALPGLIEALGDEHKGVRQNAVVGLWGFPKSAVVEKALTRATMDADDNVRSCAETALKEIRRAPDGK
jgi:HEAT repeat protein